MIPWPAAKEKKVFLERNAYGKTGRIVRGKE
jgi:hypothetical protein